jgi:cation transport protein ChaC
VPAAARAWSTASLAGISNSRRQSDGDTGAALAFVVDTGHPQYAGEMAPADKARLIARAHGRYGSCRDYLEDTARTLARHGIEDAEVATLRPLVAEVGV